MNPKRPTSSQIAAAMRKESLRANAKRKESILAIAGNKTLAKTIRAMKSTLFSERKTIDEVIKDFNVPAEYQLAMYVLANTILENAAKVVENGHE